MQLGFSICLGLGDPTTVTTAPSKFDVYVAAWITNITIWHLTEDSQKDILAEALRGFWLWVFYVLFQFRTLPVVMLDRLCAFWVGHYFLSGSFNFILFPGGKSKADALILSENMEVTKDCFLRFHPICPQYKWLVTKEKVEHKSDFLFSIVLWL